MSKALNRSGETVFLTGANGYVGSVVAEKLTAAGYAVRGLIRKEEQAERLLRAGVEPFLGDVFDSARLVEGARGAAAIVHTAGAGNPSPDVDLQKMIDDTANVMSSVAEIAKSNGIRTIITGGASLYGHAAGEIFDETSPMRPPFPGAGRIVDLEDTLSKAGAALIVRLGIVFGRSTGGLIPPFVNAVKARGRTALVAPSHRLSVVHVDDAADLYVAMLEHDTPPPIVNAVSDIVGWPQAMAWIAEANGLPGQPDAVGPQDAMMLGGPAVYMPMDMAVSGALARHVLGWDPKGPTLQDVLRRNR